MASSLPQPHGLSADPSLTASSPATHCPYHKLPRSKPLQPLRQEIQPLTDSLDGTPEEKGAEGDCAHLQNHPPRNLACSHCREERLEAERILGHGDFAVGRIHTLVWPGPSSIVPSKFLAHIRDIRIKADHQVQPPLARNSSPDRTPMNDKIPLG
ncbi:hypothetical protein P7K49_002280 [Saguinus oedipus]|uniref:Uncharacterized protein n=1 Tax=Saguinus oedipus TaxID=9490 RepID=A0ABQ9WIZ0_SAGOE|nr:hypothetical protein P7K49_002280 [Saguinus oedipus]